MLKNAVSFMLSVLLIFHPTFLLASDSVKVQTEKSSRVETFQKLKSIKTISDLNNQVETVLSPADFNLFQIEAQNVLKTQIQYEVESSQVVHVRVGLQFVPVRFDEKIQASETLRFSINNREIVYNSIDGVDALISKVQKALPKTTAQQKTFFINSAHAIEPVTVAVVLAVVGLVILVAYGIDCAYLHYYQVKCAFPNQKKEELEAWAEDFLLRAKRTQNCKARSAVEKCLKDKGALDKSGNRPTRSSNPWQKQKTTRGQPSSQ
jgi:hypothetical protein